MIDSLQQTKIQMLDIINGMDIEAERIKVLLNDLDQDLFGIEWKEGKYDACFLLEMVNGKVKNDLAALCCWNIRERCKNAVEAVNLAFDKLDKKLVESNVIDLDPDEPDVQAVQNEKKVIMF